MYLLFLPFAGSVGKNVKIINIFHFRKITKPPLSKFFFKIFHYETNLNLNLAYKYVILQEKVFSSPYKYIFYNFVTLCCRCESFTLKNSRFKPFKHSTYCNIFALPNSLFRHYCSKSKISPEMTSKLQVLICYCHCR